MNFTEYQRLAARTMNGGPTTHESRLSNWTLGLTGEAGEFAEMIKKHLFHGHTLDRGAALKELGDILWYVAAEATELEVSLEAIAAANIAKLRRRFPEGFTTADSIARVDTQAEPVPPAVGWMAADTRALLDVLEECATTYQMARTEANRHALDLAEAEFLEAVRMDVIRSAMDGDHREEAA